MTENKERIDEFYKNFKVRDYVEDNFKELPKKVLDCSLGVNPFQKNNNEYPDIQYTRLKKCLLKKFSEINNTLKEENIAFGQGSIGIIRNVFRFILESNDIVLGYSPQFPRVISEIELKKAQYIYYELKNDYKFIVDEFIKRIEKNQKAIYIDNPNNPTGQIIEIKDIERIVKVAKENNIYVIIDEAYGDYMEDKNSAITLINKYTNVIVIKSASKFYRMPDHRVGYVLASESIIKIYNNISLPFPFSNKSMVLFEKNLKNIMKNNAHKRKTQKIKGIIIEQLKDKQFLHTNRETPIFTVQSSKYENLREELLMQGMMVEDCSQYINLSEKYARIRINKNHKKVLKILNDVL